MFSGCDTRQRQQTGQHAFADIGQLEALIVGIGSKRGKRSLDVRQNHPDVIGKLIAYALCGHRQGAKRLSHRPGPMSIQQH